MLNSGKYLSFFDLLENKYFSPEDISAMSHAYQIARQERPSVAWTESDRLTLAKAIVEVYERELSEEALLEAVFQKVAPKSWN